MLITSMRLRTWAMFIRIAWQAVCPAWARETASGCSWGGGQQFGNALPDPADEYWRSSSECCFSSLCMRASAPSAATSGMGGQPFIGQGLHSCCSSAIQGNDHLLGTALLTHPVVAWFTWHVELLTVVRWSVFMSMTSMVPKSPRQILSPSKYRESGDHASSECPRILCGERSSAFIRMVRPCSPCSTAASHFPSGYHSAMKKRSPRGACYRHRRQLVLHGRYAWLQLAYIRG